MSSLRDEMPSVAAIVDEFRAVFGAKSIDDGIRVAMRDGTFYAEDFVTGKTFGTKPDESAITAKGVGADGTHWVRIDGVKK